MIKIYLPLLTSILFLTFTVKANALEAKKDTNLTILKLVKVNNHTITSNILPPKKRHAFIYKFNSKDRSSILNQLINDEIAIQYAWKYLALDDNITNEKKRLNFGLQQINHIALKESFKSISDKNASDFYEKNKKDFWHEKHYDASHILLSDKNLTLELLDTLAKASDYNTTFQALAKKYSKDRSDKDGGYLGHFPLKIMVEPFNDAIKKLEIGEHTTKPIRTRFGYHIISLHGINPKGYFSFEEVKEQIKVTMAKKIKNSWFTKTLEPLKKKAKIKYFFDVNQTQ